MRLSLAPLSECRRNLLTRARGKFIAMLLQRATKRNQKGKYNSKSSGGALSDMLSQLKFKNSSLRRVCSRIVSSDERFHRIKVSSDSC